MCLVADVSTITSQGQKHSKSPDLMSLFSPAGCTLVSGHEWHIDTIILYGGRQLVLFGITVTITVYQTRQGQKSLESVI
jgi:hypothetical protein